MHNPDAVSQRMDRIRTLFQGAKDFCTDEESLDKITAYLENTESEYRPIAYEGASMALALKDFSKGSELNVWHSFTNGSALVHAAQVHAGLGWAVAQLMLPAQPIIETLHPLMRFRVTDGCGYYDGIFRQRLSIRGKQIPGYIPEKANRSYDQGIGRSLWYTCKGDPYRTRKMAEGFPLNRQTDLWRGIGIACAYVGGGDETTLKELFAFASSFQPQLAAGAALASRARIQSHSLTQDVELACNLWCNLSAEEANTITVKSEPASSVNHDETYFNWISKIEEEIVFNLAQ